MKLTTEKIAQTLGCSYTGADYPLDHVVCDSREVTAGTLFVAIAGEKHDGHAFIRELDARYENLAYLITQPLDFVPRSPAFRVRDIRRALGMLARTHLSGMHARVIGVTGSVGKTTTKNFILSALAPAIKATGTKGNQNNELGVPLSALSVAEDDEAAVIEMGMRGLGQITYLTDFVRPDIALITNIGVSHMELLGSRENIAKAKLELVDALQPGGAALLNGDEPLLYQARPQKKCYYFGLQDHNDYRAEKIEGNAFTLLYPGGSLHISLQVEGRHQIMNALAAFGAGHMMGIDPALLKTGIEAFRGDGRRQFTQCIGGITIIDDSYNASPESMIAALRVLAQKPGRHVAVLGDMLELGAYEEQGHREVAAICAELKIDVVITAGKAARILYDALPPSIEKYYVPERIQAEPLLRQVIREGDAVLFKASNSMEFNRLARALKERMGNQS